MNNFNGARTSGASFSIMVRGYAGSYGAAKACMETAGVPEGTREHTWTRLRKWAGAALDKYSGAKIQPGMHTLLWNLGEETGFKVILRDIPLEQEAVEIAEALGLDIYELESAETEIALCTYPYPEDMTLIGHTCEGRDKIVFNGSVSSYLNRPGE